MSAANPGDRWLWDEEYARRHTVPTTKRRAPSRIFGLVADLLPGRGRGPVLDAGCGAGRNAVHLARLGHTVYCVDLSGQALKQLRRNATVPQLGRLYCIQASLESPWPFVGESFATVLDFYVSCHLGTQGPRDAYRREVVRVLARGGVLVTAVFSREDGYYRSIPSSGADAAVVVDPANGITTRLYDDQEAQTSFHEELSPVRFVRHRFDDIVRRKKFGRIVLVSVLVKRPER